MDTTTTILLACLAGAIVMCLFGGWVAGQKGRSRGEGLILGLLFGPFGVLIEALLPNLDVEEEHDHWRQFEKKRGLMGRIMDRLLDD